MCTTPSSSDGIVEMVLTSSSLSTRSRTDVGISTIGSSAEYLPSAIPVRISLCVKKIHDKKVCDFRERAKLLDDGRWVWTEVF